MDGRLLVLAALAKKKSSCRLRSSGRIGLSVERERVDSGQAYRLKGRNQFAGRVASLCQLEIGAIPTAVFKPEQGHLKPGYLVEAS